MSKTCCYLNKGALVSWVRFDNDNFKVMKLLNRLQRCIATIKCWTDYCNNREIIVSDNWLSQKHRKIIGPDGLEK